MKNRFCFHLILLFAFIFSTPTAAFGEYVVNLNHNSATIIEMEFLIDDFEIEEVTRNKRKFSEIEFKGGVFSQKKGFASLPFIHAGIQLPDKGNVQLEVIHKEYKDIKLSSPLLPSKGIIYRNQDPKTIPYAIAPESVTNRWYPQKLVRSSQPFIFRDVRGTNVYVHPFQYNARKKKVRAFSRVMVRLTFDGSMRCDNPLTRKRKQISPSMDSIYRDLFVNYAENTKRAPLVGEEGDILVLHTPRDKAVIKSYVDWKRDNDWDVETYEVRKGTNVKALIKNAYSENDDLLYVQLVGDWEDIRSDIYLQGGIHDAAMDPALGCVSGDDHYPELMIGRFSGSTSEEIGIQIEKSIRYEKKNDRSGAWYRNALGIASPEGEGKGDDGELDWEHLGVIKEHKLLPFIYRNVGEIYKTGTPEQVVDFVNSGLGLINYTGHGSDVSWGTTGFSNDDIAELKNGEKQPIIVSVACINGWFNSPFSDCFGEAWLKKENGGAVAALMATIYQPWAPPMRGQDYINDLLTGGYNYDVNPGSGISTSRGRKTFGSIVLNGLILMYSESSGEADLETIQTWTTFGDASLTVNIGSH